MGLKPHPYFSDGALARVKEMDNKLRDAIAKLKAARRKNAKLTEALMTVHTLASRALAVQQDASGAFEAADLGNLYHETISDILRITTPFDTDTPHS